MCKVMNFFFTFSQAVEMHDLSEDTE